MRFSVLQRTQRRGMGFFVPRHLSLCCACCGDVDAGATRQGHEPHPQRFPWLSQHKGLDLVLERVQSAPWAEPNHTSELLLLSRRLVSSSNPAPEGSYRQTARQQRDTVCDTTRLWLKRHPVSGTRTIGSSEGEKSATLVGIIFSRQLGVSYTRTVHRLLTRYSRVDSLLRKPS